MFGIMLITKILPFRDWIYVGIAAAAVVWFLHHDAVERARGAAQVTAAVQVANQKAEKAAAVEIASLNAQHAADVAKVSTVYENALVVASSQHATDLQRLRDYAAYRSSHSNTVLEGTSGSAPQTDAGAEGPGRLGTTAAELADALRQDDAALMACYRERDSLTGK